MLQHGWQNPNLYSEGEPCTQTRKTRGTYRRSASIQNNLYKIFVQHLCFSQPPRNIGNYIQYGRKLQSNVSHDKPQQRSVEKQPRLPRSWTLLNALSLSLWLYGLSCKFQVILNKTLSPFVTYDHITVLASSFGSGTTVIKFLFIYLPIKVFETYEILACSSLYQKYLKVKQTEAAQCPESKRCATANLLATASNTLI